ncbi:S8 family peptidase [Saccharibacillus brassicae]|uniref:S8 family peptidase n=1 Tax=Saccharibacillus brassicae TaxID=2583377 RepID=A0A4Y6UPJ8_SACBS|nr:S8 family peptidase [Saccharibacillus brassicae]QDH19553.1 S8 family peptidase [Saccharibacillus brassicae]
MEFKLVNHEVIAQSTVTLDTLPEGVKDIWANEMWKQGYQGEDVVVAILDTGCSMTHPDLNGQIIGGRNFTTDYNNDPNNYSDNNFHGTHVAGTIAAKKDGQGLVGVSPNVKLLILKTLDSTGNGVLTWMLQALKYALAWRGPKGERVRIVNMSSASKLSFSTIHDVIKQMEAEGIVVVAASGNVGDGEANTDEIGYPAYYPEVVAVGSYNMWGQVSTFSNSNNQIDLIAPGENIVSTWHIDHGYLKLSGTSMAAPHVSGAMALITNKLDQAFGRKATPKELYDELIDSCTVSLDVPKTLQGYGALKFINASKRPVNKVKVSSVHFEDALLWLKNKGMFNTPDYWRTYAVAGKTVKGELIREALIKIYIVQALQAQVDE